jgi:hypothetical protein
MTINTKIRPYLPGIVLFFFSLILGIYMYGDYGVSWDERLSRDPAILQWDYAVHGDTKLFDTITDLHGPAFELVLLSIEKAVPLTDTHDIFTMRHLVTHLFFLLSALAAYVLIYRLFRNRWIAVIGYVMIVFTPRIYAHSYMNSKDIPFMSMVLVILAVGHFAFDQKKPWLFLLLGAVCGFTTGIRIMGIMYPVFMVFFLLVDLAFAIQEKTKPLKTLLNIVVLMIGFCAALYVSWPYLWRGPIANFIECFEAFSHYGYSGYVLFQGAFIRADSLPWVYFPVWFGITVPILWLILGFAGIGWILYDFIKHPIRFLKNSNERNFLLYILSFFVPVIMVLVLNSVIYDDWRHLYFVFPPFVLLGLYFVHLLFQTRFKPVISALIAAQVALLGYFFVMYHPFEQVYFNELVAHDDEYLRRNYDMDYWGCSLKQGLEHILANDPSDRIYICANYNYPLYNNLLILKKEDRSRLVITDTVPQADYFLTNFRSHPDDYPRNANTTIPFEIKVYDNTIMRVHKFEHRRHL